MRATISVWGLQAFDGHVLDDFHIPGRLNRDIFIQNLMMETVELEVIYPDPAILRGAIDIWSARRLPIWEKLVDTTEYEYNPIWNYDRTESEQNSRTGSSSGTTRNTGTVTDDGETTNAGTTTEAKTHLHDVAGFNSSTTEADTAADRDRDNSTITASASGTADNVRTYNTSTTASDDSEDASERQLRAYGNIGVTTTQDMIWAERNVVDFSVMEVIIREFIMQFCIAVY